VDLPTPTVLSGSTPGETAVIGLITNRSDQAVKDVLIRVTLLTPEGQVIARVDVPPSLGQLDSGDVSPYAARFALQPGAGIRADSELVQYRPAASANTPLQAQTVEALRRPSGEWAILGRLINSGSSTLEVRDLAVLTVDAQGKPTGMLPWTAGPSRIPPHGSQPFVAIGPAGAATLAQFIFVRAVPAPGARQKDVAFAAGPDLRRTSQGELFVTGALENHSPRPVWGRSALALHAEDVLVGLAQVRFPLPLAPGEVRPFSIRVDPLFGGGLEGTDRSELTVSGEPEASAAEASRAAVVLLDLAIDAFEFTGSRAFVRGRVSNPAAASVRDPTVFVAIRSTEGQVLGAGWQTVAPHLPASAGQPFQIAIDLPGEINPAMAEYDLRALGTELAG
jgi:hypothetical protein